QLEIRGALILESRAGELGGARSVVDRSMVCAEGDRMANHPDRKVLEKYSQAGASAAEERWVESHLRSGCRVCQREVDDLLAAMGPWRVEERSPGEEASFARQGLFARLERRLAEVKEERHAAPPLVAELMDHSAPQRRLLVCQAVRFQNLAVCELLIDAAFET